jgi:hypothetical protein
MTLVDPLPEDLVAEIEALSDDIDTVLTKRPRASMERFASRRHELLCRMLGREVSTEITPITCIGDSHTMFFSGTERMRYVRYRRITYLRPRWINRGLDLLPAFRTYHVGASTAWKAGEPGSSSLAREKVELLLKKDVPAGSKLILSFGEIDCRIHMPRRVMAGESIEKVAEATAVRFMQFPAAIAARGFKPLVWGPSQIVPKDEELTSPTFPFIGPWELRRDITYAYLERLAHHGRKLGIPTYSLTGTYHPRNEKPDMANFIYDGVHLSQRLMPLALEGLQQLGFLEFPGGSR